jgi:endonuclease YncB( thermonuclease family)
MVLTGWALAYRRYSTDYVGTEDKAREAKRGMWKGKFVPPWEWRRGK